MIHNKVIEPDSFLLLFSPLKLESWSVFAKLNFPFLFELLLIEKMDELMSNFLVKHGRVSIFFESFINFAHLPFPSFVVEIRNIDGK